MFLGANGNGNAAGNGWKRDSNNSGNFSFNNMNQTLTDMTATRTRLDQMSTNEKCCPLKVRPRKRGNELAIFACGSFWTPQHRFKRMPGVVSTITGYTGGKHPDPNFRNTYDHTEAICIEYDPAQITYRALLDMWRDNDDPWEPDIMRHRSVVYAMDETQYQQAKEFLRELQRTKPNSYLYSTVEPFYNRQQPDSDEYDSYDDDDTNLASAGTTKRATAMAKRRLRKAKAKQATASSTLSIFRSFPRPNRAPFVFYVAEEIHQDYIVKEWKHAKECMVAWANEEIKSGLFAIPE